MIERENYWKKGCEGNKMLFIDAIKQIDKVNDSKHLEQLEKEIKEIDLKIDRIEEVLDRLDGMEEKVFYWYKVKGLTQEQTAEQLGISTEWVKKLWRRIRESL